MFTEDVIEKMIIDSLVKNGWEIRFLNAEFWSR